MYLISARGKRAVRSARNILTAVQTRAAQPYDEPGGLPAANRSALLTVDATMGTVACAPFPATVLSNRLNHLHGVREFGERAVYDTGRTRRSAARLKGRVDKEARRDPDDNTVSHIGRIAQADGSDGREVPF
ncbi:Hypothetical protein CINCED_3A003094 [Cinara cedri]|uniref:Uncharacterized protein n=1 Tax=Cinara cedri TaxID=506608 RepID=A0A5E4NIR7_9HEMI|nr:Hypothetical protein CINCED_3A003094 [Cinara cedri]